MVSPLSVAESHLLNYVQTWASFSMVDIHRNPYLPQGAATPPFLALDSYRERMEDRKDQLLTALGAREYVLGTVLSEGEDFRSYLKRGSFAWLESEPEAGLVLDDLWQIQLALDRVGHKLDLWERNFDPSSGRIPKVVGLERHLQWIKETFLTRVALGKAALDESNDGRQAMSFFFWPNRRQELGVLGIEEAVRVYLDS